MFHWIKKIDQFLLPQNKSEQFSPYVSLIYLPLFFVPVLFLYEHTMDLVWTLLATVFFLVVYFHSFWVKNKYIVWHSFALVSLGTASVFVTPTASCFFIYAAGFSGYFPSRKQGAVNVLGIIVWSVFIIWMFDFELYFSIPTIAFSVIVGVLSLYQSILNEKNHELILSQEETKRIAKIAERERIARDLHDLIGHTFSVITLKADLAGKLLDKNSENARDEINQIEIISRDALSQIREVVSGYRTSDLLSELANAKCIFASININFIYRIDGVNKDAEGGFLLSEALNNHSNKELAIVLRELVTNIIRHANASEVEVVLLCDNKQVMMSVKDDGQGYQSSDSEGFGLKGIEERMKSLGASFKVLSGDSTSGTQSQIILPIQSESTQT